MLVQQGGGVFRNRAMVLAEIGWWCWPQQGSGVGRNRAGMLAATQEVVGRNRARVVRRSIMVGSSTMKVGEGDRVINDASLRHIDCRISNNKDNCDEKTTKTMATTTTASDMLQGYH